MKNTEGNSGFNNMGKIEKHLLAESKIQKGHALVEKILVEKNQGAEKHRLLVGLKILIPLISLFLVSLVIWLWNRPQSEEQLLPQIDQEEYQEEEKSPNYQKEKTPKPESNKKIQEDVNSEEEEVLKEEKPAPQVGKKEEGNKKEGKPVPVPPTIKEEEEEDTINLLIVRNFSPPNWKDSYLRSQGQKADDVLQEAIKHYNNKNYKTVVPILESFLKSQPENRKVSLVLAYCYLNKSNPVPDKAMRLCKQIIADENSIYVEDAEWYSVLALLKKDERSKAKIFIKENILAYRKHVYFLQAQKLLRML